MTSDHGAPSASRPPGRRLRQLGHDTLFVLLGFPLGILTIVVCMVGFWLGLGLSVIVLGLPILIGTLVVARGLATVERARVAPVIGRRLPHPA